MSYRQKQGAIFAGSLLLPLLGSLTLGQPAQTQKAPDLVLVKDGKAHLPIVAGSARAPVIELQHYLEAMTGATFAVEPARAEKQLS